ncbi:MAG: M3 family metallopeptidase, partial [Bacillota bacterium]
NEIYYNLTKAYYGSDIILDSEISFEWARIPHFYYNFYVYQYATGFSAAIAISRNILDGKENAVNNYMEFLKSGDSDYPLNIVENTGVDMTTSEPIESAIREFENYLINFKNLEGN